MQVTVAALTKTPCVVHILYTNEEQINNFKNFSSFFTSKNIRVVNKALQIRNHQKESPRLKKKKAKRNTKFKYERLFPELSQ